MISKNFNLVIKEVSQDDVSILMLLIKEFSEYVKLSHLVTTTEHDLYNSLFKENKFVQAVIALVDGKPAGYAVYFLNFSTFTARPGVYIEDIYVRSEFRKLGIGKAFMKNIAQFALNNNCNKLEWSVLHWNKNASDFYKSLGAQKESEYCHFTLSDQELIKLAN